MDDLYEVIAAIIERRRDEPAFLRDSFMAEVPGLFVIEHFLHPKYASGQDAGWWYSLKGKLCHYGTDSTWNRF
jgi:hypothetical protein